MAIEIKEYLGAEGLIVNWNVNTGNNLNLNESNVVSNDNISPNSIMVDIEGIHEIITRNYTYYTKNCLIDSIPTWTKPYRRPLIMHHNEVDGKIIGRIFRVFYKDKNTKSNTGALVFVTNVPDKDGKEQIKDGRLVTTSIGAIVHIAKCSICGQNIAEEGPCEHERGQKYDDKLCYWIIEKMEGKELSYVIVPSDVYAQNIEIYEPKGNLKESKEGVLNNMSEVVQNNVNTDIKEEAIIDEKQPSQVSPPDNNTANEKLETEILELKKKNEDLENENRKLKDDLKKENEKSTEAQKGLDATRILLSQTDKNLADVKKTLASHESELQTEKTLRESLESNLIEANKQIKENLVEKVLLLRECLGKKTEEKDEFLNRTEESLKDCLKDLKEEFDTKKISITNITETSNPAQIKDVEVQENVKQEDINIEESIKSIFTAVMGGKRF